MKTQRLSARPVASDVSLPAQESKSRTDAFSPPRARNISWLGLGLGALACASGLRPAAACEGLNPLQKGWMSPPSAWPSSIAYGDIVATLAASDRGPNCYENAAISAVYGATVFFENTFSCGGSIGAGFCASRLDLNLVQRVEACGDVRLYPSDWLGSRLLRPIDTCGVLRAKDCIFFFPDDGHFQAIEDGFTRALDPACHGFNPQQHHWQGKVGWPSPTDIANISSMASGCSTGPACGSAVNYDFRSFNCSGQLGTIIGQADLDLALNATAAACPGPWEALSAPPQEQLFAYTQTQVQQAWDVGFFFTANGSSQVDARLLTAAKREIVVLRKRHDAAYMWRVGMCASAATSVSAILTYGLARGSVVRKLGIGLGMGYAAGILAVSVGGVKLGWVRIDDAGRVLSAIGVGAAGIAYVAAFGFLLDGRLR